MSETTTRSSGSVGKSGKMPGGIPYIVLNEAAERYSFYGMRAILTVFMTQHLLNSSGELDVMTDTQSNVWYHTFVMAVYFFPILGALLSDLFLGKYRTIIALSLVYCLGHLALAIDQTRIGLSIGLTLIAVGAGGIKPCVSAHVGDQFDDSNAHLLEKVYGYFYLAINVGAASSMILGQLFLDRLGPHVAFGIPGLLMLLATIVFWMGRRKFISIPPDPIGYKKVLFSGAGVKIVGRLSLIYLFVSMFWALFDQTGSSWVLQAKSHFMDKQFNLLGMSLELLPSQIQSINPILILVFTPLFTLGIYPLVQRLGLRLTPLRKIGFGLFLAAGSFALIALAETKIFAGETVHASMQLWASAVLTAAEVMVSITCLEFSYAFAPNSMKSFIMGLYFLSFSLGNFIAASVNKWMKEEVKIEMVETGGQTIMQLSDDDVIVGRKIMFEGDNGLVFFVEGESQKLTGTFIMEEAPGEKSFELVDSQGRKAISSEGDFSQTASAKVYVNKLVGPQYFWFFTRLMLLATALFIPVAYFFKGNRQMQDHERAT